MKTGGGERAAEGEKKRISGKNCFVEERRGGEFFTFL